MMTNHLSTLKQMCLDADIKNNTRDREALGWALARLSDLTGTKVGEALWGQKTDPRLEQLENEVARLTRFAWFICQHNRIDLDRMTRQFATVDDK